MAQADAKRQEWRMEPRNASVCGTLFPLLTRSPLFFCGFFFLDLPRLTLASFRDYFGAGVVVPPENVAGTVGKLKGRRAQDGGGLFFSQKTCVSDSILVRRLQQEFDPGRSDAMQRVQRDGRSVRGVFLPGSRAARTHSEPRLSGADRHDVSSLYARLDGGGRAAAAGGTDAVRIWQLARCVGPRGERGIALGAIVWAWF